MAMGKASDFKVYNEFMHSGLVETLVQVSKAFNAATRGALRLSTVARRGEYNYQSFFKNISGLISRRDTTSVAGISDMPLTMDEYISVKLNRKIGPVSQTLDAFKKIQAQAGIDELDFAVGQQAAEAMSIDMLDAALGGLVAALAAQSTNYLDGSAATMTTNVLVNALAKMGDAASRVVMWVMPSKVYYDLVLNQIALALTGVSDFNIATATPVTLNRPVLVTDAVGLNGAVIGSPAVATYHTLALVEGAAMVENSEEETIVRDWVTGNENLGVRYQGEYAYNLGIKGSKWDTGNGGANPNNAALITGSNWDKVATSYKDLAGVAIRTR